MPLLLFAFLLLDAAVIATVEAASNLLVIALVVISAVLAVIAYAPAGGWRR